MLYRIGRNLVRLPRYLNPCVIAEYLLARRYHHTLASIAIHIAIGMQFERRRKLPHLAQNTMLRVCTRLHLHDSRRGPASLVTKLAPNSNLHRLSALFSYHNDNLTFFDYTLLEDGKAT